MNRHQPYHPMNPRTGISPAHATAPSYGYASPDTASKLLVATQSEGWSRCYRAWQT